MQLRLLLIAAALAGCGSNQPSAKPTAAPNPDARPLSGLAADRVIVLPTYTLVLPADLPWASAVARPRDLLRTLDADIAATLDARGLRHGWVLPPDLQASFIRNPTYATDPYTLAEAPLVSRTFGVGSRLTEPLASQLRTMVALHENARLVLAPVELRFTRVAPGSATTQTSLRVVLVDPRFSEARWVGEVKGDTASALTPQVTATLAKRLVDLVTPP